MTPHEKATQIHQIFEEGLKNIPRQDQSNNNASLKKKVRDIKKANKGVLSDQYIMRVLRGWK